MPQVVPITPPIKARATSVTPRTGPLFRRKNFLSRYVVEGGDASTGSSCK